MLYSFDIATTYFPRSNEPVWRLLSSTAETVGQLLGLAMALTVLSASINHTESNC